MTDAQWDKLLNIRTSGRDDTHSDRFRYPYEPTPYSVLERLAVSGTSHIQFVIGGSLGLSDAVLARADRKLSFSAMTFPHQLMRVILLEQIYRAYRIQRNEPYHK